MFIIRHFHLSAMVIIRYKIDIICTESEKQLEFNNIAWTSVKPY